MNFFFFLDHPDKKLESSVDVFNKPPSKTWSKQEVKDVFIYVFYSDGEKWISSLIGILKKNEYKTIKKTDLPKEFQNKSVFISLSTSKDIENNKLVNENYMNSIPAWRSNIKISSKYTSCSFQGEIPGSLINKNLSLVSCSPMIQSQKDFNTFFYLINLNNNAKKIKFKVNIMNTKKEILYSQDFYTNTVNILDINRIPYKLSDNMYVFTSQNRGGVPIYFTKNKDNTSLCIEHTHPPASYVIHGNRSYFQKEKKSYWFT